MRTLSRSPTGWTTPSLLIGRMLGAEWQNEIHGVRGDLEKGREISLTVVLLAKVVQVGLLYTMYIGVGAEHTFQPTF